MPISRKAILLALACAALTPRAVLGQQMPNPYGEPIGLDAARKAADAALAEGKKNGWTVAAAVVDLHGELVVFERLDGTQYGSNDISVQKARSAARFKRPTKTFEDAVKSGQGMNVLGFPGAVPLEGGIPIVANGKIVGAIGVSGATSAQDGQCAKAGADVLGGAEAHPAAAAPKR